MTTRMHGVESFQTLCPSLTVRDQVLHMYKTKSKIIFLCILMFMFLDKKKIGRIEILD